MAEPDELGTIPWPHGRRVGAQSVLLSPFLGVLDPSRRRALRATAGDCIGLTPRVDAEILIGILDALTFAPAEVRLVVFIAASHASQAPGARLRNEGTGAKGPVDGCGRNILWYESAVARRAVIEAVG